MGGAASAGRASSELRPLQEGETPPAWFTTIDSGTHSGWAAFIAGKLYACGRGELALPYVRVSDLCIIEKPRYRRFGGVNPNDLITQAINVGEHRKRFASENPRADVELITPEQWKGGTPKHVHHPRILRALDLVERKIVTADGADGNTLDAIGIGLWYLGRLGP